jgi:uncharacterized Rossmann fold enzyme
MDLSKWSPWYRSIVETFGFDIREDQKAADVLSELIAKKALKLQNLKRKIKGKPVIVFGAGPSLDRNLREIVDGGLHKKYVIISANGATTALLHTAKIVPDIIVTDLDGRIGDILKANREGAIVVVHAHGDNIEALKKYVPKIEGNILGSTQVEPRINVYNFGGFTDGDRGAFLAEEMGSKRIVLAGMDLGFKVGKYSKPNLRKGSRASLNKRKKLEMAKRLLTWLSTWAHAEIVNVTVGGEKIIGIRDVTCDEL